MPKILRPKELKALLSVETTVEQAKQIIERNQVVLDWMKKNPKKFMSWNIACPHCIQAPYGNFECKSCAYSKNNPELFLSCTRMTFGGFSHYLNIINEVIRLRSSHIDYYPCRKEAPPKQRRAVTTWLKGHIEWAEEVIRRAKKKTTKR